jgi:radical SAM/Cys-rich protein
MTFLLPGNIRTPRGDFEKLATKAFSGVRHAEGLSTLTVNVGLRCNLECELCYQASSPSRSESMSRAIMLEVLHFASDVRPELVDLTGGEPVLWPSLTEFLQLAVDLPTRVRVRTNLDALLLPEAAGVAGLLARYGVEVLASLPEALEGRTIGGCVEALKMLAELGYGDANAGAIPLDLTYNPLPGELPRSEEELTAEFRAALGEHGVRFGSLVAVPNVALGSFAKWLDENGEFERYRTTLRSAFDPATLPGLPCRHGIAIAWDGRLCDCDYNIAADVPLAEGTQNVSEHTGSPAGQIALSTRVISFSEHCFACTARGGARQP